jgi:hypothetical protein
MSEMNVMTRHSQVGKSVQNEVVLETNDPDGVEQFTLTKVK